MSEESPLETRVQATVLFLLDSILLLESSGGTVRSICCPLIKNIEGIKNYEWRTVFLACLPNGLNQYEKVDDSSRSIVRGTILATELFTFRMT